MDLIYVPEDHHCEEATRGERTRRGDFTNSSNTEDKVNVVTTMGSASSIPLDLGAVVRDPGGDDDDGWKVETETEKERGVGAERIHPPAGRRASSSSSTTFASAAEAAESDPRVEDEAPARQSNRILFDGVLVEDSKIGADSGSPGLVLSDEDTAASASSSAGGSTVEAAAADAASLSVEECVEHGEDGLKCAYPGSNGRCRHSMYGSPLPAGKVLERMGPEWALAAAKNDEAGRSGCVVGVANDNRDGGGGLIWHVRIVPDNFEKEGAGDWKGGMSARDFDAESGRIKPRRGKQIPVLAGEFFSSLVRIEGGGGGDSEWEQALVDTGKDHNRVSTAERGANDKDKTRREEQLWGMWDKESGCGTTTEGSEHGSDSILHDITSNQLDVLPTVDNIPLIGTHLSLYLQSRANVAPCRYVFSGVLNGWPGLTTLELLSIQTRGKIPRWSTRWSHNSHGRMGLAPSHPEGYRGEVRAILRAPPWSAHGWSQSSPGFVFWYEPEECCPGGVARLRYGTSIVTQVEEDRALGVPTPRCTRVHMVSHRYAKGSAAKETSKDRLTYHSIVLLEWDHGKYCTVVEGAFLNGIGGYAGRSNWCYDEPAPHETTGLYRALPPEMVMPWKSHLSEIRCIDVPSRNLGEFKSFVARHEGHDKRFVDAHYNFSHDVRLTFRSKDHIATYLLNYITRDRTYSEIRRNCQTFAADLCGFLAGKKDVQPFHPVNQVRYTCWKHYFLYDSEMYS